MIDLEHPLTERYCLLAAAFAAILLVYDDVSITAQGKLDQMNKIITGYMLRLDELIELEKTQTPQGPAN